jgi:hypothetical protein
MCARRKTVSRGIGKLLLPTDLAHWTWSWLRLLDDTTPADRKWYSPAKAV